MTTALTVDACWRPADAVAPSRFQPVAGEDGSRLVLARNVSMTPRQVGVAFLALCVLSLLVGLGFWWLGAGLVMVFTGIELLAVAAALLVAARHVGDREVLTLSGRCLRVERHCAGRVTATSFCVDRLRIEPGAEDGGRVSLSGEGRRICVGRHVRPEWQAELIRALRQWVRGAGRPEVRSLEDGMQP